MKNSCVTLSRVVLDLNESDDHGGGIYNEADAEATVTDSTISRNFAGIEASGGGIWNGGIFRLERSTVSGNGYFDQPEEIEPTALVPRTDTGGGIYNANDGTFLHGETVTRAVMTIVNSTISGNVARSSGGGIYNEGLFVGNPGFLDAEPVPTVNLNHSTVTGNTANARQSEIESGGGIFNEPGVEFTSLAGTVRTMNTILAGNTAEEADDRALVVSNCGGQTPVSEGDNLESADTCALNAAGDLKNTNALLSLLADNGGPTKTHELLVGSPAIDTAAGGQSCPATDQRGTTRPQGAGCDTGAYERLFQAPPPPPPPPPAPQPPPVQRPPAVAPRCNVPNVKGKTVREARRAITRAGCKAVVMGRRYSATAAPGRVIGQSVPDGRRVRRGTVVRLLLSRGGQPVRPPFTG